MATIVYRYELRRGNELVATGRLSREQPLEVGSQAEVAGLTGTVHRIEPLLGERDLRLILVVDDPAPDRHR